MKPVGSFALVLHAHLPYVLGHGTWPHGMDWIFEAAAETYLPLIRTLSKLESEGLRPAVTVGLTPILCEQLKSEAFKDGFKTYLRQKAEAARDDRLYFDRTGQGRMKMLATMWEERYAELEEQFKSLPDEDITAAFKALQDGGAIEIITCAATHGYLPLLGEDSCINAQIKTGAESYRTFFGKEPRGIWLPECAYRPAYFWKDPVGFYDEGKNRAGIEYFVGKHGLRFFFIDHHLLEGGKAIGAYLDRFEALKDLWKQFEISQKPIEEKAPGSCYETYFVGSASGGGMAAIFVRDPKTAVQVWSGEHGYPGDGNYLDFHKKRFPGGHRYWRVTAAKMDLGSKQIYDPQAVPARLSENAGHFITLVKSILKGHLGKTGRRGIVTAPYDAELFGHWWFEGPDWIYEVIKSMCLDPSLEPVTCSEYLQESPPSQVVALPEGSWGEGGFHWIWLNEWTEWMWGHIYSCESRMKELARLSEGGKAPAELTRVLKQLARELLLLESSDWQFLVSTWTARDYAEMRFAQHKDEFEKLYSLACRLNETGEMSETDLLYLEDIEARDGIFGEIDPTWWAEET